MRRERRIMRECWRVLECVGCEAWYVGGDGGGEEEEAGGGGIWDGAVGRDAGVCVQVCGECAGPGGDVAGVPAMAARGRDDEEICDDCVYVHDEPPVAHAAVSEVGGD